MNNKDDFSTGYAIWEKQAKQFFEKNAAALDHFLANPFSEASLDTLIKHFKASANTQQTAFDFIPQDLFKPLSSYHTALLTMTTEAIDLLQDKMRALAKKKALPQTFRECYELWLECGEDIYQQWLKSGKLTSAFSQMINGMFEE